MSIMKIISEILYILFGIAAIVGVIALEMEAYYGTCERNQQKPLRRLQVEI